MRLRSESATTLEAESGYIMETPEVAEFRRCILNASWDSAEATLVRLGVTEGEGLWVRLTRLNWWSYSDGEIGGEVPYREAEVFGMSRSTEDYGSVAGLA